MKVQRHHYAPTLEQRVELKRHAAQMRGRIRAMRALRDITSGFSLAGVSAPQAVKAIDAFRAHGWSDSAAGELAGVRLDIGGPAL